MLCQVAKATIVGLVRLTTTVVTLLLVVLLETPLQQVFLKAHGLLLVLCLIKLVTKYLVGLTAPPEQAHILTVTQWIQLLVMYV